MLFLINNKGNTPLDAAIENGDIQKAEVLINRINKSQSAYSLLKYIVKPS